MPRAEAPILRSDGPVAEFATMLREVRHRAGTPTYRTLATRSGLAACTLSKAAAGKRLPSLGTTLRYVAACGESQAPWPFRWQDARARLKAAADASQTTSINSGLDENSSPQVSQISTEIAAALRSLVDQVRTEHSAADLVPSCGNIGRKRRRPRVPGSTRHLAEAITAARGPVGAVGHVRIAKALAGDPRHALDKVLVAAIVQCCHQLCGGSYTREDERIWSQWIDGARSERFGV